MTTVETLNIEGAVTGDFSKLDDVFDKLIDIGMAQDAVFPIDIDQDGAEETWAELTALEEKVEEIDDASVDVGSDFDTSTAVTADGGDSDTTAVGDGGGTDFVDAEKLRDAFGDAFDERTYVERGGELTQTAQLLEGGIDENIDVEGLVDARFDSDTPEIDGDFIETLSAGDWGDDVLGTLRELDLTTGDLDDSQQTLLNRIDNVSLSMSSFYRIVASLLPLIGVIVAAIPAVIAGLAALAAAAVSTAVALGAVAGIGLLGIGMQDGQFSMEPIQEELQALQEDFIEAFAPIGRVLAGDVRAFFADIGRLFDRIASRGRVLQQAGSLIRAVGDGLVTYLPGILETVIQLGTMAAPLFGRLLSFFASQDFGQIIGNLINELIPLISQLGRAIFNAIPGIIQLSKGFLAVTVIITNMVSAIIQWIDALGPLAPLVGVLIGVFAVLYSVASIANIARSTLGTLNLSLSTLSVTSLTAAQAVGVLLTTISLGLAALPAISAFTATGSSNDIVDTDEMTSPSTSSMGGTGSGSGSQTYNYYVNADSRSQGNRQGQALRYGSTYSNGTSQDASYGN